MGAGASAGGMLARVGFVWELLAHVSGAVEAWLAMHPVFTCVVTGGRSLNAVL